MFLFRTVKFPWLLDDSFGVHIGCEIAGDGLGPVNAVGGGVWALNSNEWHCKVKCFV